MRPGWGWFSLPVLAAVALVVGGQRAAWRGDWNRTIDVVTGSTTLSGPVVGGIAAFFVVQQGAMRALTSTTPRTSLVVYVAATRAAALGLVGFVVAAAVAIGVTALTPHGGQARWSALLVGPLVVVVAALAGAAAASVLPHHATVVLVPVGLFMLGDLGPTPLPDLLRHGPVTGSLAGLTFDAGVLLARLVGLVGLVAVLAVALLPWSRWRAERRHDWRALARPVAGALVAATLLVAGSVSTVREGSERFTTSSERPTVCVTATVAVCLAPARYRFLDETATPMGQAAVLLQRLGAPVPDRFEQLLPGYTPPIDVGMLDVLPIDGAPNGIREGAQRLMRPAPCPAWTDPTQAPPEVVFLAEQLMVEAVLRLDGAAVTAPPGQLRTWLMRSSDAVVGAWVRDTYAQFAQCRLDDVALPYSRTL